MKSTAEFIEDIIYDERAFLKELAEDLESTLLVITYTEAGDDLNKIKESQEYLRKKYSQYDLGNETSMHEVEGQLSGGYQRFVNDLLKDYDTLEEIKEECERILYENLTVQ